MENITDKPIRRVLVLADFACATGFANVAQNIVNQILIDKTVDYQIDIVGINYHGMPNEWQNIYPRVRIFPAALISGGDLFGRKGYFNLLASGAYDLTWILQDTFNVEGMYEAITKLRTELIAAGRKAFKFIFYFPIDAEPKENWITKSVSIADVPVAYTQYGRDAAVRIDPSLEKRIKIIPHGVDTNVFKPLDPEQAAEFRQKYFMGMADGKYLVLNVNRNQPRKDVARTMQIFRLFKNQVPNAILYLHMRSDDVAYNLHEVARNFDLIADKDFILPKDFNEHDGVSPEIVNYIYNSADCLMTTTLGEGWGLSITEAMATKLPVVAPDHTSITEILADERGLLVKAGRTQSEWIVLSADNERKRPLASVADFVEKLVWLKNNRDSQQVKEMIDRAYKYVNDNWTWDIVGEQWRDVFKNALTIVKPTNLGRNDKCHCGSGLKFKHCHGREQP